MTSSPIESKTGARTPTLRSVPEYVDTLGHEAIDFMTQIGHKLDPWQADIVVDAFGRKADGRWSARDVAVLCPRQNGKGGVTEGIELAAMFLFREKLILHSAHEFKTSTEAFRRICDIIDGCDWTRRRVKAISKSKGDEGIELVRAAGGSRLRFVARSLGSGRGFSASRLIFDEAYALTLGQYSAQTPTLATIPNPQIIYTSTPPDVDTGPLPADAVLPAIRRRGKAGDKRLAYYEWSPDRTDETGDRRVWLACNPAVGIRIPIEFLADQYESFKAAGSAGISKFRTEHLGEWPVDEHEQWLVITEDDWNRAADESDSRRAHSGSQLVGRPTFAIDMTPSRSHTAIAVSGRRSDGLRHIEIIDHRSGSGWVVARAKELQEKWNPKAWIIDPSGPAGSLIADFETFGLTPLVKLTAREMTHACGQFFDGIAGADIGARDIRHRGQGALTAAVAGAMKRELSGGWAWARKAASVDISPLVACTMALYGAGKPIAAEVATPWVVAE